MRKLKLQVQISVDGYIAGPNGEMDWMTWDWDDRGKNYVKEITNPVDTIILGRKLAEGFIDYWTKAALDPEKSEEFARKMHETPKVVFTKTLQDTGGWTNTQLAKGELTAEIMKLKNSDGGDIIVYGGSAFVSALIREDLIDEFHLFINPVAVGNGMTIFSNLAKKLNLTLVSTNPFDCGIVVLCYKPKKE